MSAPFTLELQGGVTNKLGGPADEYYLFRVDNTRYRPYATAAEACTRVPVAARVARTVNVDGVECWWLPTDTSDAGLIIKSAVGLMPTAEFYKQQAGRAYFALSTEAIVKQVANLLRRRPIKRQNIVADPVAPLPALPAAARLPGGLTAPGATDFAITAKGVAAAGSPVIAEWTRGGTAGSVILVSGEGLLASTAAVYAHGKLYQAKVRNTSARQMQVQLPANLGQFDVFVLWPKNAQGYGEPVLINCAEAWWAEDKIVAGETFSIFGDYLAQNDTVGVNNAYVAIQSAVNLLVYEAEVVEVKLDYLTVRAPAGLAIGGADCYVHNKHGGLYGVSKPIRVNCVARQDHILYKTFPNVINIELSGELVNSNGSLIQNNFNGSNGRKSLRLPAGTFTVCDTAYLGDVANGGGEIVGAPLDDSGRCTTIFLMREDFVRDNWNFGFMGSTQSVDNIRLRRIEFRNPDGSLFYPGASIEQIPFNFKKATNLALLDCVINAPKNTPFNLERGIEYVYIRNCKITGGASTVMQGRQLFIDDCIYKGCFIADALINASGVTEAAARRITFGDKTPGSLDEFETMKGRFYKVGLNYGSTYHVCVSYNTGHDVGPLASLGDQNEGEMILPEGAWQVYAAAPTATTADTITFPDSFTNHYDDYDDFPFLKMTQNVVPGKHMLRIIDGPGTEQVFHILSHDGHTLTLDRPFRVRPTAASLVQIGLFHDRFSVEGNDFSGRDGVASRDAYNVQCGFNSYGGGSRCNVKRNKFTRLRAGLRFDGTYEVNAYQGGRMIMPAMAMNIQGNIFDGCRRHVFFVAAQDDRNPPNYYTFPGAAIIGCRFSGNVFKNALEYDVELEAARSEQHSALNNGASIQNVSFDGEFGVPTLPIKNTLRFYEGLAPVEPTPSTLQNLLLAPAAADEVGVAPIGAAGTELGPPELLPNLAVAGDIVTFDQADDEDSQFGWLDEKGNFIYMARTFAAGAAAAVDAYTKEETDELLASKAELSAAVKAALVGAPSPGANNVFATANDLQKKQPVAIEYTYIPLYGQNVTLEKTSFSKATLLGSYGPGIVTLPSVLLADVPNTFSLGCVYNGNGAPLVVRGVDVALGSVVDLITLYNGDLVTIDVMKYQVNADILRVGYQLRTITRASVRTAADVEITDASKGVVMPVGGKRVRAQLVPAGGSYNWTYTELA